MDQFENHTLIVVDLVKAKLGDPGDSSTVRGGKDWQFTRDNCLEVVETFLEEYGIEMHYTDVEYIAKCLTNHRDAYVEHYLFSYV